MAPGPIFALTAVGLIYAATDLNLRLGGGRWPAARTISFVSALVVIATGLCLPMANEFAGHAVQHLLLGMLAPILLALSAPISLLLRTVSRDRGRQIVAVLRSAPLRLLSHPVFAAVIYAASMFALYLTPLYTYSAQSAVGHGLVHLHLLIAGCLFCWPLIGLDPVPRRSLKISTVALVIGIGAHAALAKLLYAGSLPGLAAVPTPELHEAAIVMYYGGDLIELALIAVFFTQRFGKLTRVTEPLPRAAPVAGSPGSGECVILR